MKNTWKIVVVFLVLFLVYHAAEYMIVFKNNPLYFFCFQGLFFVLAWFFGNWYSQNGLTAWGLPFQKKAFRLTAVGVVMGVVLYAFPFGISLLFGVENIVKIPDFPSFLRASLPFAFGVFFSSFSEDILTRGVLYAAFGTKVKWPWLALGSAFVYLLNHIYRWANGPETWLYLFLLGLVLVLPLLHTKTLWLTGAMHWAGNVFFYVTHSVVLTASPDDSLSPNTIFALCMVVLLPWYFLITRKMSV